MPVDINALLTAGYPLSEITDYLGKTQKVDVDALRKAGYPDDEISQYLNVEHGGALKSLKSEYYGAKSKLEEAVGLHEWAKEAKEAQQKIGYQPITDEDIAQAQGLYEKGKLTAQQKILDPLAGMTGRYLIPTAAGFAALPFLPETGLGAGAMALSRGAIQRGITALTDAPIEAQENIEYRKEQPGAAPDDVKAWAAAVPQAIIAGFGLPWMKGPWSNAATKATEELAPKVMAGQMTRKEAEAIIGSKVAAIAKGLPENAIQGTAMMAGTEALRRGQAGQDVFSPEAFQGYAEDAKTAALFAPIFGTVHGMSSRKEALHTVSEAAKQRKANFDTWNQAQADQAKAAEDAAKAAQEAQELQRQGQEADAALQEKGYIVDDQGELVKPDKTPLTEQEVSDAYSTLASQYEFPPTPGSAAVLTKRIFSLENERDGLRGVEKTPEVKDRLTYINQQLAEAKAHQDALFKKQAAIRQAEQKQQDLLQKQQAADKAKADASMFSLPQGLAEAHTAIANDTGLKPAMQNWAWTQKGREFVAKVASLTPEEAKAQEKELVGKGETKQALFDIIRKDYDQRNFSLTAPGEIPAAPEVGAQAPEGPSKGQMAMFGPKGGVTKAARVTEPFLDVASPVEARPSFELTPSGEMPAPPEVEAQAPEGPSKGQLPLFTPTGRPSKYARVAEPIPTEGEPRVPEAVEAVQAEAQRPEPAPAVAEPPAEKAAEPAAKPAELAEPAPEVAPVEERDYEGAWNRMKPKEAPAFEALSEEAKNQWKQWIDDGTASPMAADMLHGMDRSKAEAPTLKANTENEATNGWQKAKAPAKRRAAPKKEPVEEAIQGTAEQRKTADNLAKDIGGTVVWQRGDLGLIRGFSSLSGEPVYAGVKDGSRTRVDIASFTGKLFTPEEKSQLVAVKDRLEAEDAERHAKNPSVKFDDAGLAFSKTVPPELRGIIEGWKKLLGIDTNIYVTTLADAAADKDIHTGPMRAVGSATLSGTSRGETRMVADGNHYLVYDPSSSRTRVLEVISHELGHIHEKEKFRDAPPEVQRKLRDAHAEWLGQQKGKTAREFVTALRAKTSGKTSVIEGDFSADQLSSYWKSFSEWYADQTAKWATSAEKPVGVVEQFFAKLGAALRRFYTAIRNAGYLPNETFRDYIESVGASVKSSAEKPVDTSVSHMVATVSPIATPILERMGREPFREDTRGAKEKIDEIIRKALPTGKAGESFVDSTLNALQDALEINKPLERALRSSVYDALPEAEANELMTRVAMSQTAHDNGVADMALLNGGIKFNKELGLEEIGNSQYNWKVLAQNITDFAKAHDLSHDEANYYAHTALVAKRMVALYGEFKEKLAAAEQMKASKNPSVRTKGATEYTKNKEILDRMNKYMTEAQAKAGMELFEKFPEIREIEKTKEGIRKWIGEFAQDTGIWSEELKKELLDNVEWVPFDRKFAEEEEEARGFKSMIGGLQARIAEPKFKGSAREIENVFGSFGDWAQYIIAKGIRNRKAQQLANASLEWLPESEVKRVPGPIHGATNRTVYYLEDGKPRYVLYADPKKANTFRGMEGFGKSALPIIGTYVDKFNHFFRENILTFPIFPPLQLAMDSLTAVMSSGIPSKFAVKIPLLAVREAINTMRGTSEAAKQLAKYGAVGVRDFSATAARADMEVQAGLKKLKGYEWYKDKMHHFGMIADNAVRQAVYIAAKEAGVPESQAIMKAFENINFRTRLGSHELAAAARNVMFLNAFYASTRVALKVLRSEGISPMARLEAKKAFLSNAAWMMGLSMALSLANNGDPDYEKMTREEQLGKITAPGLGGWGLPIRPDVLMLPMMVGNILVRQLSDQADDPDKLRKTVSGVFRNAILSGPMMAPQPIVLGAELATNYNFFTGRPIVGAGQEHLAAYKQYSPTTSEIAKDIGVGVKNLFEAAGLQTPWIKATTQGLSPLMIEHFIRGAFGMNGAAATLLFNSMASNRPAQSMNDIAAALPGMGRVGVKDFDSALKTDFYNLASDVDLAVATANNMKNHQQLEEYIDYMQKTGKLQSMAPQVNAIKLQLNNIRKQIGIISDDTTMSDTEKQARITQIREIEAQMMKQWEPMIRQMRQNLS